MEEVEGLDYEVELKRFSAKMKSNRDALQRLLNTFSADYTSTLNTHTANTTNSMEERDKLQQRIEEVRQSIRGQNQEREGVARRLEKLSVVLQCKSQEVEGHQETLAELNNKIKKAEMDVSEARCKDQVNLSQAESSIQLFKTHLGLDIMHIHNDSFVFKFTQVNPFQPDSEYLLEMKLAGDTYHLLMSEPPLPSLPQLEQELNASGNLLACLVQVRQLYEAMEKKKPGQ